jgi:hypothetical protein
MWRGCIRDIPDQTQIEYTVRSTNLITGAVEWLETFGNNRNIRINTGLETLAPALYSNQIPDFTPKRIGGAKLKSEHGVFVSLTTSPSRIHFLPQLLTNLDFESIDLLIISIPEIFSRTGETYSIPTEIMNHPKIAILRTPDDAGPIMKLIPALEYLQPKTTGALLITVDDDIKYPKKMISELARIHRLYPNSILGSSGQDIDYWNIPRFGFPKTVQDPLGDQPEIIPSDVLEGFGGVAYPVDRMNVARLKSLSQLSKDTFTSDDLVIGMASAFDNIPRLRVATPDFHVNAIQELDYGKGIDALHKIDVKTENGNSNSARYYRAYKRILETNEFFDFQTLRWKPTIHTISCSEAFTPSLAISRKP